MYAEVAMVDLIFRTDDVDCPESKVLFEQGSVSPPSKRRTRILKFAPSPWSEGYIHPKPPGDLMLSLMEWYNNAGPQYFKITWVTSEFPGYISVHGSAIRDQIVRSEVLDFEICDLIVRRLIQLDTNMEPNSSKMRWRHILESDFSVCVLVGTDVTCLESVRQQFIGDDVRYNMSCTRMFAVPSFIEEYWCAHMFDMKEEVIHVIGPLLDHNSPGEMKDLHVHSSNVIQEKLFECCHNFFETWHPEKKQWPIVYPELTTDRFNKKQSGLCMLHCLRNYNGDELEQPHTLKSYPRIQHTFLYEILGMKKNKTRLLVPVLKIIAEPK